MNKLYTLLTILMFFGFSIANAQLVAHYTTTHSNGNDVGALLSSEATIINTSGSSSVVVKVLRTNTHLAPGHESYFCWDVACFPVSTDPTMISPNSVTLGPGDSTISFIGYTDPKGTYGIDTVTYSFYDSANTSNNVTIDFTYDFATGINALASAGSYMFCSQSNNDDRTNVSYSISNFNSNGSGSKLIIRNLLGSVVKEIKLNEKQGVLSVATSDMPSGIYMYLLNNNGESVATKKMVILHR